MGFLLRINVEKNGDRFVVLVKWNTATRINQPEEPKIVTTD
jgi:hypothetical protein